MTAKSDFSDQINDSPRQNSAYRKRALKILEKISGIFFALFDEIPNCTLTSMNILLLGGSGLLGKYFQKILKDQNISYLAPSRAELDITDENSITDFKTQKNPRNFSHILFCAAYTNVDQAETHQAECEQVNVLGLEKILQWKIPIIHFSTDYVFGHFPTDIEIEEHFPRFPINYYGGTKLRAEKLLEASNVPFWNIRTSWLFGGKNDFVEKILRKSEESSELSIIDDQIGRPTFAKDLVEYTVEKFLRNSLPTGHYHLQGSGEPVSWAGFADFFLRKSGWNGTIKKIPGISLSQAADRPQNSVLKNTRLPDALPDWKDAVQRFLNEQITTP